MFIQREEQEFSLATKQYKSIKREERGGWDMQRCMAKIIEVHNFNRETEWKGAGLREVGILKCTLK
jgi:hypothetical protein